jgi:hypothetical protein
MFTESLKDVIEGVPKIGVAVRIAIFPPWKIQDVESHMAVNLGAVGFLTVLYLILRQYTPEGSYGLTVSTIVTAFAFLLLVLAGLLINAFDPTESADKMSNRWATFLVVGFIYSLIILLVLYLVPPLVSGGSFNFIDWIINGAGSERRGYAIISVVTAAVSVAFLYCRAWMWFRPLLALRPALLALSLAFCVGLLAAGLYGLVFAI